MQTSFVVIGTLRVNSIFVMYGFYFRVYTRDYQNVTL